MHRNLRHVSKIRERIREHSHDLKLLHDKVQKHDESSQAIEDRLTKLLGDVGRIQSVSQEQTPIQWRSMTDKSASHADTPTPFIEIRTVERTLRRMHGQEVSKEAIAELIRKAALQIGIDSLDRVTYQEAGLLMMAAVNMPASKPDFTPGTAAATKPPQANSSTIPGVSRF